MAITRLRLKSLLAWLCLLVWLSLPALGAVDERGPQMFESWRAGDTTAVDEFTQFLDMQRVSQVQTLHEVLRTASSWKRCGAAPFAVPPRAQWEAASRTLRLLDQLKARGILAKETEIVSGYRPESLATCAQSRESSSHTKSYAVDFLGSAQTANALCTFWKKEGRALQMGLSKYDTGRIHIDTKQYRTWGSNCTCETSYCQPCARSSSPRCP